MQCKNMYTLHILQTQSINLDTPINLSHKEPPGQDTDCAKGKAVDHAGQGTIGKEEQSAHKSVDIQLCPVIPDRVDKDPEAGCRAGEE